uniref:Uncharacterized protein n=1 Tax=uncultured Nitrospirae bacterium MY4-5C TaxID=798580 RepID=D9MPA3_9BACT|nr:hypothetical protein LW5_0340 [uncultured Nitrospirae bacterium MY4-5C]
MVSWIPAFAGMTEKREWHDIIGVHLLLLEFICSALPVISMFFILSFPRTDCVIIENQPPPFF